MNKTRPCSLQFAYTHIAVSKDVSSVAFPSFPCIEKYQSTDAATAAWIGSRLIFFTACITYLILQVLFTKVQHNSLNEFLFHSHISSMDTSRPRGSFNFPCESIRVRNCSTPWSVLIFSRMNAALLCSNKPNLSPSAT